MNIGQEKNRDFVKKTALQTSKGLQNTFGGMSDELEKLIADKKNQEIIMKKLQTNHQSLILIESLWMKVVNSKRFFN